MPKLTSWMTAALAAVSVLTTVAWAQQAPPTRIRGTIEAVNGSTLSIKTLGGSIPKSRMSKRDEPAKRIVRSSTFEMSMRSS